MSEHPWYERAFGDLYPLVYAHRNDERARREVEFVRATLELSKSERILDVGCGTGRHLRAFAHQGYLTYGIDLSRPLLSQAREGHEGHVLRADMRALPFVDDSFDAATSFFTSFAFFPTTEEDQRVLNEIARVVRPGGRYFLDYLDAKIVRDTLIPATERRIDDLDVVERRRIENDRVKKRVTISRAGKELARYEESVRLYDRPVILAMLEQAGFAPFKTFAGYDGETDGTGARFLVVSRKKENPS